VCRTKEKLVNVKTILKYLIITNMNIFLTVTTFHILASMEANEASTSWKENSLFPPFPPWTTPSLREEIGQRNVKQYFCIRSQRNSDGPLAKSK